MKLKRMLGIIVAMAMVCTLISSVGAATLTRSIQGLSDDGKTAGEYDKIHVSGSSVTDKSKAICPNAIKSVKFVLSSTTDCKPDPDDANAAECQGKCVAVAVGSSINDWDEKKFCLLKDGGEVTFTFDSKIEYLQVAAAFFGLKGTQTANISILDKDGAELALGAGCKEEGCQNVANCLGNLSAESTTAAGEATTAAGGEATTNAQGTGTAAANATTAASSNNNNNSTGSGTTPLNTGVGGVMALGGMAVLAAGAVIISGRKRK